MSQENYTLCPDCTRAQDLRDKGFPEEYLVHCFGGDLRCNCGCSGWKKTDKEVKKKE